MRRIIYIITALLIVSCAYKSTCIESYQKEKKVRHPGELLILVNDRNKIPDTWNTNLVQLPNGKQIDQRVYPYLMRMTEDAKKDGCRIAIASAYRSNKKQVSLYNTKCAFYQSQGYDNKTSQKKASQWVSQPGTSEHQLGVSVDLVSYDYQLLDKKQEETKEQKWLMNHCAQYGFILRYPVSKRGYTHVNYEPWHYRYVGKHDAVEIMNKGICLEEYLNIKHNKNTI